MDKHTFSYEHNGSSVVWDVKDIWEVAESLPVSQLPISNLKSLGDKVFKTYIEDDYTRAEEADLKYPIIVSDIKVNGNYLIIDGYHRLFKHIQLKHKTIPVKFISKMPRPLYCKGEPFEIPGLDFDWYDPRKK